MVYSERFRNEQNGKPNNIEIKFIVSMINPMQYLLLTDIHELSWLGGSFYEEL